MPLRVPSLDDRTYADLVQEGISLIPRYSPSWTNHNASDPGITLLELFAYLTEIFLYRLDRVSDANKEEFLKLLTGKAAKDHENLENEIRTAVLDLRRPFRAVSCEDFESLAKEATEEDTERGAVRRVQCFPRRNLEMLTEDERRQDRAGHVSIIFVPENPRNADTQAIKETVEKYLEPRRLLTSRVHVVGPRYLDLELRIRVALLPGVGRGDLNNLITTELHRFFDPLRGGPQDLGWPFGRSVYISDVYRLLEAVPGLDHVTAVAFDVAEPTRLRRNELGEIVEVQLRTEELVHLRVSEITFEDSR